MLKKILILVLLVFGLYPLNGQDLDEKLKVDPNVTYGVLENGFTYYIRHNEEPKDRLELRLAVNTGSIMEDEDQQGLAHLLEHMCFNGTEHFEKSAIVDFIESTGVKFGQHLNAYTSFDETVYMLQMPTDRQGIIDSAFLIMEDWAHNVNLEDEEIDKERGVVIEEWRLGLGAQERMRNEFFPVLLKDSKYAERLPIGKMDVIENCDYETIRRFYHDWYRPDLMALIVVGDIDVAEMEQKVKDHFSGMENPVKSRERVEFEIPNNEKPLVAITTDDEATYFMVNLFYKHDREIKSTVNGYREYLKESLYNAMLNARLSEISQNPEAPFMYSFTGYGGFLGRSKDAYSSFAATKENMIGESLDVLLTENERVKKFGFTTTEFDRHKMDLLRSYEKNFAEKDKRKSRSFAQEYISNFLSKEPVPGIEKEFEMAQALMPGITLEEINILAKEWITDENIAVLIMAPEKEGVIVPTEEEVIAIIDASKTKELTAYEDKVLDEPLISKPVLAGMIASIEETSEGYEKWTMENGAEVYIKSTDFKNDEILYKAYTTGGSSLIQDDELAMTMVFEDILNESGLGNFSGIELEKKLSGQIVSIRPYLSELEQGFSGSVSPKDLETLLQLQYLYFTKPRQDKEIFNKSIVNLKNQMKFILSNPKVIFYDTLAKVLTSNSPRTIVIPTEKQLDGIQQEKIFETYNSLFQQADDYKFFFVGNIDKAKLKPLVEQYIGSFPPTDAKKEWKDVSPEFPTGVTELIVNKGKEPQGQVSITMKGDFDYTFENKLIMKALVKVLSIKLREKVREEESGTYGIGVRPELEKYPKGEYTLSVNFGCAPDNVEKLVGVIFDEFKRIRDEGPLEADMVKARETFLRERETNVRENRFWLNQLFNVSFYDSKILSDEEYNEAIKNITNEQVKEAANKYLTLDHYVYGLLLPEETEE
jgi:zinc protease